VPKLETRGIDLAWESFGVLSGPTTVFVHETATSGGAWRPLAERIAKRGSRAVVYDRRGWGNSSAPTDYLRTTVEEQSEDLAELVAMLGTPVAVCGGGLGGLICLDLLLRHPELAQRGLLLEPLVPGLVPAATEALSEDRESLREAVQDRGPAGMLELYLGGRLLALGPGVERIPAEMSEPARERPGSLAAALGAAGSWSYPLHRLAEAQQPISVVTCSDTPALLREAADALADRLAASSRADASHPGPVHLRAPGAVVELLSAGAPK